MDLFGGQWQKVAIARAIYCDAPILIMDEPTSAIDAEHEIFKNLIFIFHRFSTVRMAKRIFVLEKGKQVEEGSHEQLVQNNEGLYLRFFQLQ